MNEDRVQVHAPQPTPQPAPQPAPQPFVVDIGCGDRKVEGAFGVDFRPIPGVVDLVADVSTLDIALWREQRGLPLCDALIARHVLEHFPYRDSARILARWVGLLRPGGVCRIEVPRMDFIARHWFDRPGNLEWQRWLINMAYGEEDYVGNFHMTLFSPELLKDVMERAGLAQVQVQDAIQVAVGMGTKPEGWEMPSDERLSYPFQHFPVTFR